NLGSANAKFGWACRCTAAHALLSYAQQIATRPASSGVCISILRPYPKIDPQFQQLQQHAADTIGKEPNMNFSLSNSIRGARSAALAGNNAGHAGRRSQPLKTALLALSLALPVVATAQQ